MVYRTFTLRAPQRLTWRQVYRQFGAHPAKASNNNTVKLQEAVLASHRDLEGSVAQVQTWHESAGELMAQVETLTVRLKNLGRGFLGLVVFMLCILAGFAGGFLALLAFRLSGG